MTERAGVDGFWAFAVERQAAWHRRHALGRRPPWTDDEVLARYHFCNVDRYLDRGTQIIVEELRAHAVTAGDAVVALNAMLYRLVNRASTWRELVGGWVGGAEDATAALCRVREAYDAGVPVFSKAWIPTGGDNRVGRPVDRMVAAPAEWSVDDVVGARRNGINAVARSVSRRRGFGMFTATQVALDLAAVWPELSADRRLHMRAASGDGRVRTAGSAAGAALVDRRAAAPDVLERLRADQPHELASVLPPGQTCLTRSALEHALCEYAKYVARRGVTAGARTSGRGYPAPDFSAEPDLFQVRLRRACGPAPWENLVACALAQRTRWAQAGPVFDAVLRRWPSAAAFGAADLGDVERELATLGLQRRRAETLRAMSAGFARRFPGGRTPYHREVADLAGVGKYALDSYRIFLEGDRGVVPDDVKLRAYLEWERPGFLDGSDVQPHGIGSWTREKD